MKKPRYTDQKIAQAVRQAEQGTAVAVCRDLASARDLLSLEEAVCGAGGGRAPARQAARGGESATEAGRADLTLDRQILQEVLHGFGAYQSS